jgi:hypothetical protein
MPLFPPLLVKEILFIHITGCLICAKKIRVGTKMKIGTRKGENICCGSGGGGVYHPVW